MTHLGQGAQTEPGWVVWITGLPGAGKSTLAKELTLLLRSEGRSVVLLDGDGFREAMGSDLAYTMKDRMTNARRICGMSHLIAGQGIHVVVATVSLFETIHRWNREHQAKFRQVLIQISPEALLERVRGSRQERLYAGDPNEVVGRGQRAEFPADPDLVIRPDVDSASLEELAKRVANSLGSGEEGS